MSAIALQIGFIASPLEWAGWPVARAALDPAIQIADEAWPEVETALAADDMQLVVVTKGGDPVSYVLTRSAQTKRGEVLEVYACGGSRMNEWLGDAMTLLQASARDAGFVAVRVIGRLGWERALAGNGFRRAAVMLEAA